MKLMLLYLGHTCSLLFLFLYVRYRYVMYVVRTSLLRLVAELTCMRTREHNTVYTVPHTYNISLYNTSTAACALEPLCPPVVLSV